MCAKSIPSQLKGAVSPIFFWGGEGGRGGGHCELPKERINFSGVVEILVSFC